MESYFLPVLSAVPQATMQSAGVGDGSRAFLQGQFISGGGLMENRKTLVLVIEPVLN